MKVEVLCVNCGKKHAKDKSDIDRNVRESRLTFCSPRCRRIYYNRGKVTGQAKRDDLTPFRWFLSISKARFYPSQIKRNRKRLDYNLTLIDLHDQWEVQRGRCPYTGWKLILPKNSSGWNGERSIKRASLDRRESSKGYTPENIQFVSIMANYAKNNFSEQELIEFCNAVHENKVVAPTGIAPVS